MRFGFAALFMAAISISIRLLPPSAKAMLAGNTADTKADTSAIANDAGGEYLHVAAAAQREEEGEEGVDVTEMQLQMHKTVDAGAGEDEDPPDDSKAQHGQGQEQEQEKQGESKQWWVMPEAGSMTRRQWKLVTAGVGFVTFVCPALGNFALFQISMSLCVTLTSFGPLYSVPLAYAVKKREVKREAILGSLLAVAGVFIMCFL